MLNGWISWIRSRNRPGESRLQASLVRTVPAVLLLLSLFPLIIIGPIHYFRTRSLLQNQAAAQLETISASAVDQLIQYINVREPAIDRLVGDESFSNQLVMFLNASPGSAEQNNTRDLLYYNLLTNPRTTILDSYGGLFLIDQQGSVLLSTDSRWKEAISGGAPVQNEFIHSLIGSNQSVFAYLPEAGYEQKLSLFTTRSFVDPNGSLLATLIAVSSPDLPLQILNTSESILPGSEGYYFTQDSSLMRLTEQKDRLQTVQDLQLAARLNPLVGSSRVKSHFFDSVAKKVAFAEWIPEIQVGILIAIPQSLLLQQINLFDPLILLLLGGSLILSGLVLYFGSLHLVNPLLQLAQSQENFANGDWSERSRINRKDEIGHLANSYNRMAGELGKLIHSLESVVQKRTSQLRVASEAAQIASSTSQMDGSLAQLVNLIAERFDLYFVAIYLVNESGQFLFIKEASGQSSAAVKKREDHIEINLPTLVSWVARYCQPQIIASDSVDGLFTPDDFLPDTRSEVAVPIFSGSEVLGVLDIQSVQTDAFDFDSLSVFQTLANQISSVLLNKRLLESTQVSYEETALLYRATRQIAQARSSVEVVQNLTETLTQLPFYSAFLAVEENDLRILVATDPRTGRVEKSLQGMNFPAGRAVIHLAENHTVLVEDITQPSEYEPIFAFLLHRGYKSAALLAIMENSQLSKLLVIGSAENHQITNTRLLPYSILADVIGASLDKYNTLGKLEKRVSELHVLAAFGQNISVETRLNKLFRVLHEQTIQIFGPDLEFAVALYNQRDNLIQFPYFYEQGQLIAIPSFPLGEGLTSFLIESRKPLLLADEKAVQAITGKVIGREPKSWMGVPLIYSGGVVGAVLIQDLDHENRFSPEDVSLFTTLAPQIAIAVRNTELYDQAQEALHAYDQERFLLNTLLDHTPESITFKDTQSRYIRASRSAASLFALSPENMLGKTDRDLIESDRAEKIVEQDLAVMNSGAAIIGQVEHGLSPSGAETWTHTSRIPIFEPTGTAAGLLTIQRDITELKQAEELAQRRVEQLITAAEIARDTAGTLDVNVLLKKSVTLICDRFGFYHSFLFLLDPAEEYAVLRASSGLDSQQVLQTGFRLAVGSKSIVGQVTASGEPRIVSDITQDPNYLFSPLLPDTHSEAALPLKIGKRVLGALDVQSAQLNSFHAEDIGILQTLADQLAVALANAELFAQTHELLRKHRLLRQVTISASSSSNLEDALSNVVNGLLDAKIGDQAAILLLNEEHALQVRASSGVESSRQLETRVQLDQGITGQAAREACAIRVDDIQEDARYSQGKAETSMRSELAVPILFSNEMIGVLNLQSAQVAAFDENDQEILSALGSNLGGVIANLRMVNRIRQQVLRERQLYEAASNIRRSIDLETILETSTREICKVVGARRARVVITAGKSTQEPPQPGSVDQRNNGHHTLKGE